MTKLIIYSFIIYFVQLTENRPGELSSYMNYYSLLSLINYYCKNSYPVFHCA